MKRTLGVLLGLAALLALVRLLVRRRGRAEASEPDPRAEALRRKLADRRAGREEPGGAVGEEAPGAGEATSEPPATPSVEESRRRVHEDARAALEEMRRAEGG